MDSPTQPIKLKAFVIGPIGDRYADEGTEAREVYEQGLEVLENIVSPACGSLDIETFRADQISTTGEIPEQVFRHLRDSHIVVADLTGANPNVLYELGLRHTTGKLTIQIGEKDRLPFDVAAIRTIMFKRSEMGFIEAKRSLIKALIEGLESGGNPVSATRVWFEPVSEQILTDPNAVELDSYPEDDEEPGFLELVADTESATHDMTQTLATGSSILGDITRVTQEGTARIAALPSSGNYSAAKLAEANRIAADLEDPAVRLRIVAQDYARHVKRATPGMLFLLNKLVENPEELEQAGDFPEAMALLVAVAGEQLEGIELFIEAFRTSGSSARSMRKVANSIVKSSEMIRDSSQTIASWKTPLNLLIESRESQL